MSVLARARPRPPNPWCIRRTRSTVGPCAAALTSTSKPRQLRRNQYG